MDTRIKEIWERVRALRDVIEAHRDEGQALHHLPDPVARAFVEANVYRLYCLSSTAVRISTS